MKDWHNRKCPVQINAFGSDLENSFGYKEESFKRYKKEIAMKDKNKKKVSIKEKKDRKREKLKTKVKEDETE